MVAAQIMDLMLMVMPMLLSNCLRQPIAQTTNSEVVFETQLRKQP